MSGAYQHDPDMASDSEFEPGRLDHLVIGNHGRLLDARRTPVRLIGIRPDIAMFAVEVLAFEDAGARWDLAMDVVDRYQFAAGCARATADEVASFSAAIRRFDRRLDIEPDAERRDATLERLAGEQALAVEWLEARSAWAGGGERSIDVSAPTGDERLFGDIAAYMSERGVDGVEREFVRRYVSNPSAEFVKAHAVVVAELGLAPYHGPIVRDPDVFRGDGVREHRIAHIVSRLAFVRAMFSIAGHDHVDVYRGMSFEGPVALRPTGTFVSATFSRAIAEAQATLGPTRHASLLASQRVGVERVFVTYHETAAMNEPFQEAEALLLADPAALF